MNINFYISIRRAQIKRFENSVLVHNVSTSKKKTSNKERMVLTFEVPGNEHMLRKYIKF